MTIESTIWVESGVDLAGEALAKGYVEMAADKAREAEAEEWVEALISDVS